jgi:hypothetical protein
MIELQIFFYFSIIYIFNKLILPCYNIEDKVIASIKQLNKNPITINLDNLISQGNY